MVEWFEDDEFWSTWYPFMFTPERMARAPEKVDQILHLIGFAPRSILDLACGPGRHAVEFAKRGYQVTGVDRSPYLLSRARQRAAAAGVEVEWVERDMREFERPEAFDLTINMFTSFGYFDDKKEDLRVLAKLWTSLKPGGALLIDVIGKEWLARHFEATSSSVMEDGSLVINRREIFDDWTRILNEWILIRSGEVRSFKFHHTIYSGQELRERLEATGFHGVELHGDLEGNRYGIDAQRLVAVARK